MKTLTHLVAVAAIGAALFSTEAVAQSEPPAPIATTETVLVTVVLRHDQSLNITEIVDRARANGLYDSFPPAGAEIRGWTIAMGLGQIVTLELPPSEIRNLNRALEFGAWGAFETDVYLGYDFLEIAQRLHSGAFEAQN